MTRRQYRLSTESNWQSGFGMAMLALMNTSGSGRKLTLRSLEVGVSSMQAGGSLQASVSLWKGTDASGQSMNQAAVRMDSATALPSGVVVRKWGGAASYVSRIRTVDASRFGSVAGTQNTLYTNRSWGRFGGSYKSERKNIGAVEPITVAVGECLIAIASSEFRINSPMRVRAVASVNGKTVVWEYVTSPSNGLSLFSLENTGAATVKLLEFGFSETGTTDTPYLRLVPVGQVKGEDAADTSRQIQSQVTPMDSTYPALTALTVHQDVGIVPLGVPESYIAQGSTGTPKGFNYLHTKDFDGPTLRVFFPEMCHMSISGAQTPDTRGYSYAPKNMDLGVMGAGIAINPGEGLAIVASAETAVAVQASFSGWPSLIFSMQIDDEPQSSPYLNLTGLRSGSDIVVLVAGTSTILQQIDAYGSTAWAWNYDPDVVTSVDIGVLKTGFIPLYIRGLALTTEGASIPISQVADRNFS